jgi:glutamate formiminotransferase
MVIKFLMESSTLAALDIVVEKGEHGKVIQVAVIPFLPIHSLFKD